MSIREQVNELREHGQIHKHNNRYTVDLLNQAADTIEFLSAKSQAANVEKNEILKEIREKAQELSNQHWSDDERHLVGKGIQCMCVQAENIIKANMERSAELEKVWRYCKECKYYTPLKPGVRGGARGHCEKRYQRDSRRGCTRACKMFSEKDNKNEP